MSEETKAAKGETQTLGIEHVDRERARRIVNVLTEAPYFYRDDDPDLFQYLRRYKAAFDQFFEKFFGWALIADGRCARLFKRKRENRALLDSQSDAFGLTRRNQCLAFALLLEYFEVEARRTNWDADRDENLRFFYYEFLEHCKRRFAELLGERAPDDAALQREIGSTWDVLLRYRFVRFVEPTAAERMEGSAKGALLYEFLPAVYLYDTRVLADPGWVEKLKTAPEEAAPSNDDTLSA
jgi:hypothetical protein